MAELHQHSKEFAEALRARFGVYPHFNAKCHAHQIRNCNACTSAAAEAADRKEAKQHAQG